MRKNFDKDWKNAVADIMAAKIGAKPQSFAMVAYHKGLAGSYLFNKKLKVSETIKRFEKLGWGRTYHPVTRYGATLSKGRMVLDINKTDTKNCKTCELRIYST